MTVNEPFPEKGDGDDLLNAKGFLDLFDNRTGCGGSDWVEKIIEIGTTDNQSMEHLDILCNRFGGRLIGSDAYENAAIWAASKFEEWGMEVVMDEVGELPVGFNRGPWFGRMLSDNGMQLHFATPSYTSGTKGVQRGHVLIEPKSQSEFDRMKGALNGAWVLISGMLISGILISWMLISWVLISILAQEFLFLVKELK